MAIPLPFDGGFYVDESLPVSNQECINFYVDPPQTKTVTTTVIRGTAGLKEIANAGADELNRGGHEFNGVPYEVNDTNLYRIDRAFDAFGNPSFSAVQVGAIPIPGDQRVIMADNGLEGGQILIIAPELTTKFNAFIFTPLTGVLVAISDSDFDGPVSSGLFIDGFFLFTKADGQKFFISNLRDGLTYDALDFGSAEVDVDPIKAPFTLNNELWIYGSRTAEPFANIGGSGFPFQRIEGGVFQKGLTSVQGIQEVDGNMIFLGAGNNEQPSIWASNGSTPQPISTTAIDNQIGRYTQEVVEACFTFKYKQAGALFVGFTFPGERTFVYNVKSGLWNTLESIDAGGNKIPYRVSNIVTAYGELIVGDTIGNKFGIIDRDTFTEYTEIMRRKFILPPLDNGGDPFFINSIEAVLETGVGLTTGQGSDPKVLMSLSRDGARIFEDTISRSAGKKGEYNTRVVWNAQGRVARQVSVQYEVSDPVRWVFYKIEANID